MPDDAGKTQTSLPFRARLSIIRQRIILKVRSWFHLIIDDIKDQQTQGQIDMLFSVVEQQAQAINQMINVMNGLTARLSLYEREIPRMRDLRRQFDLAQSGLDQIGPTKSNLVLSHSNGKILHP